MKTYTREEREAALKNLPKPVEGFARSNTITDIYLGIAKKHKLNWRELSVVSEITNLALMGLELESGVETNIHQTLPELSNAATHELVADLNDRIFKEAKRRLRENILEPEPEWDESELGPKPKEGEVRSPTPTTAELRKIAEEEERQGGFKHPEDVAEEVRVVEEKKNPPPSEAAVPVQKVASVVEQKLAAPTAATPEKVQVPSSASGVQNIEKPEPPRKADPYREIPE